MVVDKFAINVEQAALKDLTRRLDATRWPDEIADSGWEFSTELACVKSLVAYCRGRLRLAERRSTDFHNIGSTSRARAFILFMSTVKDLSSAPGFCHNERT